MARNIRERRATGAKGMSQYGARVGMNSRGTEAWCVRVWQAGRAGGEAGRVSWRQRQPAVRLPCLFACPSVRSVMCSTV